MAQDRIPEPEDGAQSLEVLCQRARSRLNRSAAELEQAEEERRERLARRDRRWRRHYWSRVAIVIATAMTSMAGITGLYPHRPGDVVVPTLLAGLIMAVMIWRTPILPLRFPLYTLGVVWGTILLGYGLSLWFFKVPLIVASGMVVGWMADWPDAEDA